MSAAPSAPTPARLRRRRDLARDMRQAIWRLRGRQDMSEVLAELRQGLLDLGIAILYCGVNIVDRSTAPPGVVTHSMNPAGQWRRLQSVGARNILRFWEEGRVVYRRDLARDDPYGELSLFADTDVGSIIDVPFAHGTLAVSSRDAAAFSDWDVDLLQEMAGLLEDGFHRLDEIRRVEVRLAIREKVWQMRGSQDIEHVMSALRAGFDELGFRYSRCGINQILFDVGGPDDHAVMWHSMERGHEWTQIGRSANPLLVDFWRAGVPAYRPDLEAEDPHDERHLLSSYYGKPVRCVIDVPFSHGTLALNSTEPHAFSDDEIALLQDLASVLEEGFRRLDDLRALESRNRKLEAEVTERRHAEQRLARSLEEKEILLREVHHRVKNNLQVVSSLLSLRADGIADREAVQGFTDSRAQIESMALIHERLYQSQDLAALSGDTFLRDLAHQVLVSYGAASGPVTLHVSVDADVITVETAIHCGLIVHELVANSLKHAFPDGRAGNIRVTAERLDAGRARLTVCDDGIGLDGSRPRRGALGLRLINDMARKLGGHLETAGPPGARFDITFPCRGRD